MHVVPIVQWFCVGSRTQTPDDKQVFRLTSQPKERGRDKAKRRDHMLLQTGLIYAPESRVDRRGVDDVGVNHLIRKNRKRRADR